MKNHTGANMKFDFRLKEDIEECPECGKGHKKGESICWNEVPHNHKPPEESDEEPTLEGFYKKFLMNIDPRTTAPEPRGQT